MHAGPVTGTAMPFLQVNATCFSLPCLTDLIWRPYAMGFAVCVSADCGGAECWTLCCGHCADGGGGSTCPSAVTSASHQLLQHMNRGNLRAARPVAHFAGPKVGVPALVADPVRRSACCATAAHGLRDLHDILTFPTPARHKTSVLSMALTVVAAGHNVPNYSQIPGSGPTASD